MSSRKAKEYAKVKKNAEEKGFEIVEPEEHYQNQRTEFTLRCKPGFEPPDGCCGTCKKMAAKIVHQGECFKRGKLKAAKKRRLPWEQVRLCVDQHPSGLVMVSDKSDYRNQDSLLKVKCRAGGHEPFLVSYGQLRRRDTRMSNCPDCGRGIGEALALSVGGYLLGVTFDGEQSPPWILAGWNPERGVPRLDGYIEADLNGVTYRIGMEHNGPQHYDPNHWHHRRHVDPAVSFQLLIESDNHKKLRFIDNPTDRLIIVDDLTRERDLIAGASKVCSAVVAAFPEIDHATFELRLLELTKRHGRGLFGILRQSSLFHGVLPRLEREADELGMDLISYDPVSRQAITRCRSTGHVSSPRSCTSGIRSCVKCTPREMEHLDAETVIRRVLENGWTPCWSPEVYKNQYQLLEWKCVSCGTHHIDTALHKFFRTCSPCRNEERAAKARKKWHRCVQRELTDRGDTLLTAEEDFPTSAKGKVNYRCTRKGGCQQLVLGRRIEKILRGQCHRCVRSR